MVLDPPMPFETDEKLIIKIVRIAVVMLSIGYPLGLFAFRIYPKIYYDFVNQSHPESSLLFNGGVILLFTVFLITISLEKYYKKKETQPTNSNIPRQIDYLVLSNLLMFGYITFELMAQLLNADVRITVFQLLISILGVTTPLAIILRSDKLSTYASRFIKDKYDDAFIRSIFVVPVFLSFFMYLCLYSVYCIFNV